MSNLFAELSEDFTIGISSLDAAENGWEVRIGQGKGQTPLSHRNAYFKQLLSQGTLNYKELIDNEIEDFRQDLKVNRDFHLKEGRPEIPSDLIVYARDFFQSLYENLVDDGIILPLFGIDYYEGHGGSIEISLRRSDYQILVNLSSEKILYSIIHKIHLKKIRNGSDELNSVYQEEFIKNLISDIRYFEK